MYREGGEGRKVPGPRGSELWPLIFAEISESRTDCDGKRKFFQRPLMHN